MANSIARGTQYTTTTSPIPFVAIGVLTISHVVAVLLPLCLPLVLFVLLFRRSLTRRPS